MRAIRSVLRKVPAKLRAAYVEALSALAKHESAAGRIRGFYLVEKDDRAGEFQEFWEYADRDQARAHAAAMERDATARDLLRRLREAAPDDEADTSFWAQRL